MKTNMFSNVWFVFFFTYINKKKEKEFSMVCFFLYNAIKKERKCMYGVHKQQRTDVTRKDNEN